MTATYLPRHLDAVLAASLEALPAVIIDGARATGKTESTTQIAKTILHLENPIQADIALGSPDFLRTQPTPVLLDEWEQAPQIWDLARREVDRDFTPGRFIITGSAVPKPDARAHTGAGRFLHLRLRPMTLSERQITTPLISLNELLFTPPVSLYEQCNVSRSEYFSHICQSGFPQFINLPAQMAYRMLDEYIQEMIQSDLDNTGYRVVSPANLLSWLRAYAAATSTDASYRELMDQATTNLPDKPAKNTVNRYRDLLERIWILDPLQPWELPGTGSSRQKSRAVHHLCDPALAARLLKLTAADLELPKNGEIAGRLFESLATLCVRSYAELQGWTVGHYRQRDGRREIDLIVQADAEHIAAFEVKASAHITDADCRHLLWFKEQIGTACRSLNILYTGDRAYRRPDGILVIPLALLK